MSFRFTLALLVLAIVAIAGFGIAQKEMPAPAPSVTPTPALISLDATDVNDLDVKTSGSETELVKGGSSWALSKPDQDPNVDQAKVSGSVAQLAQLKGSRSVASTSADLQPYGLRSPQLTVTLKTASGKSAVLLVGDKTVDGNNAYAMTQGGSDVALIPSSLVTSITALATNPPRATPTPVPTATLAPAPTAEAAPAASGG